MERPYNLFGPAFGVVHIYIRDRGDEACETFKGIEYYYRLNEDGWDLEHSAGCAAKQHHIRAFQSYIQQGSGVHYTALDEALGIEFDVARAEEYLQARQEGRNPFLATHSHGEDHADHSSSPATHAHDTHGHNGHGSHAIVTSAPDHPRETAAGEQANADDARPSSRKRQLTQKKIELGNHADETSKEEVAP